MGKRLMSTDLTEERGAIAIRALCLDPGPKECGVAILEYFADSRPIRFAWGGKYNWDDICTLLSGIGPMQKFNAVVLEDLVPAHGNQMVASKYLIETAIGMGRVKQKCLDSEILCYRLTRRMVIKRLQGKAPGPKNKVSKADMQVTVQEIMGLDKPIRPQHANDAACVGLAVLGHPNLPNTEAANDGGKKRRPRKKAKSRRTKSKA